jgi:hypothetical protein
MLSMADPQSNGGLGAADASLWAEELLVEVDFRNGGDARAGAGGFLNATSRLVEDPSEALQPRLPNQLTDDPALLLALSLLDLSGRRSDAEARGAVSSRSASRDVPMAIVSIASSRSELALPLRCTPREACVRRVREPGFPVGVFASSTSPTAWVAANASKSTTSPLCSLGRRSSSGTRGVIIICPYRLALRSLS